MKWLTMIALLAAALWVPGTRQRRTPVPSTWHGPGRAGPRTGSLAEAVNWTSVTEVFTTAVSNRRTLRPAGRIRRSWSTRQSSRPAISTPVQST